MTTPQMEEVKELEWRIEDLNDTIDHCVGQKKERIEELATELNDQFGGPIDGLDGVEVWFETWYSHEDPAWCEVEVQVGLPKSIDDFDAESRRERIAQWMQYEEKMDKRLDDAAPWLREVQNLTGVGTRQFIDRNGDI